MKRLCSSGWAIAGSLTCIGSFFLSVTGALGEIPAVEIAPASPTITAAEISFQQIQESQQALLKATEQLRLEAAAAWKSNTDLIARRIDHLHQSLDAEHEREWESILRTHQLALGVASVIAGVTLIGLLLSALLQVRAIHKLTNAVNAALLALPPDTQLPAAIARIEKQLEELERTLASPPEPTANEVTQLAHAPAARGPRMALSIGGGDALSFLPTDIKPGPRKSLLARLRKMFPAFRPRPHSPM